MTSTGHRQQGIQVLAVVLVLTLTLNLAGAAEASSRMHGEMLVEGVVVFPPGTNATTFNTQGLVADAPSPTLRLSGEFRSATVCYTSLSFVALNGIAPVYVGSPQGPQTECQLRHEVRVEAVPGRDDAGGGYVGLYADHLVAAINADVLQAEARPKARIASRSAAEATSEHKPNEHAEFVVETSEEAVLVQAEGFINASGTGRLKLRGLDVRVSSAEANDVFSTGARNQPAQQVITWVFITFAQGEVTLYAPEPARLVTDHLQSKSDGDVSFTPTGGAVVAGGVTYTPDDEKAALDGPSRARVSGQIEAILRPGSTLGRVHGVLALEGELRETTLTASALAPGSAGASASLWPLLLLGAVLVGTGLAGARHYWRHRAPESTLPRSAREYYREAVRHMSAEEFDAALERLERARQVAPTNAMLALDAGFCLTRLGREAEAVAAYQEAATLAPRSGEAAFRIAKLLRERDRAEAHRWLRKALQTSPALAQDVEESFPEAETDPALAEAVSEAYRAIPGIWSDRYGRYGR